MSRYTRALRKQARAQAKIHAHSPSSAGNTALLDEPVTDRHFHNLRRLRSFRPYRFSMEPVLCDKIFSGKHSG
jgi:hypothetical protein